MKAKVFQVGDEESATIGAANLLQGGFTTTDGKHYDDLEVGESCSGYMVHDPTTPAKGRPLLRITRVDDRNAI
jgi:hypothetical protein